MTRTWLVKAAALGTILALAPKPVGAQNIDADVGKPVFSETIKAEAAKLAAIGTGQSLQPQAASQGLPTQARTSRSSSKARSGVALGLLGWFAGWQLAAAVDRHRDSPAPELIGMSIGAAAGAALGVWLAGR
jgi:hypothetical protein